jgi:hypothetical protein
MQLSLALRVLAAAEQAAALVAALVLALHPLTATQRELAVVV